MKRPTQKFSFFLKRCLQVRWQEVSRAFQCMLQFLMTSIICSSCCIAQTGPLIVFGERSAQGRTWGCKCPRHLAGVGDLPFPVHPTTTGWRERDGAELKGHPALLKKGQEALQSTSSTPTSGFTATFRSNQQGHLATLPSSHKAACWSGQEHFKGLLLRPLEVCPGN